MTTTAVESERVIRRFIPVTTNLAPLIERGDLLGALVDVESSGLDPAKDQIIELCIVPFTFTANGAVTGVGEALTQLEDPDISIPDEITKITGITNDDVRGKRIVDGQVNDLVRGAAIVISHNADFDRKFAEKRLPIFENLRWGCLYRDIDWKAEGFGCAKLRCLTLEHLSMDFDSHRADIDAYVAVKLLSSVLPSGMRVLHCVLDGARRSHARLYATGSPYEYKDLLKQRGYRWDAEYRWNDGRKEKDGVWFTDVVVGDDYVAEWEWLANHALCGNAKAVSFSSKTRFSDRIGKG